MFGIFGRGAVPVARRPIRTVVNADENRNGTEFYGRVVFTVKGTVLAVCDCPAEVDYIRALEFAQSWLEKCDPRAVGDAWGETFAKARPS